MSGSGVKNINEISRIKKEIITKSLYLLFFYIIVALISYLIFSYGITRLKYYSQEQLKSSLKEKVSLAMNVVTPILNEYKSGKIDKNKAITEIHTIGQSLKYADEYGKNYIFVNSQTGVVYVRPYKPEDEMRDLLNSQDSKGHFIMREVIKAVSENPQGAFVEYLFPNPMTKQEEPKLSYVVLVSELNCHIGTGAYYGSALKKQIKLAHDLYWWGLFLALLFSLPFFVIFLLNRKNSLRLLYQLFENKRINTALTENEIKINQINEYFKITLNSIGDGVISTDKKGCVTHMNPVAEMMTGYSVEEALGKELKSVFNIINAETRNSVDNPVKNVIKTGAVIGLANHTVLISKDNTEFQIADSAAPILNNKEIEGVVLVFRDVTEEYRLRDEAARKDIFFKTVFDTSPYSIMVQRFSDQKLVMVNSSFLKNTGYTLEEALGKTTFELGLLVNDNQAVLTTNQLLKQGFVENFVVNTVSKNGISGEAIISSRVFEIDKDKFILTISNNITEIRKLEEQLNHAQKMDAIGQLAGGVAHDFNNILAAILGTAELMILRQSTPEQSKIFLNNIIQAAQRASDLTKKLLMFSRKGKIESTPVDVHRAINEAVEFLKRSIDKKINISVDLTAPSHMIVGDLSQLINIFLNLGINASHAMPNGGEINITSHIVELDERFYNDLNFEVIPGSYIAIEFSDSGTGISSDNLKRIFEPFFTTKEQGKGTGLGLAAVYGTIQQHKGAITVYSELGKGTVFHLYLPLSDIEDNRIIEKEEIIHGKGCILVVDDEEAICIMAKSILEYIGYSVLLANNGVEGVKVYQDNQNVIDLIIMDMMMPEMNGKECFYELKKLNENIKVIISSGFSQEKDIEQLKKDGVLAFIRKPFHTAFLSKVVSDHI